MPTSGQEVLGRRGLPPEQERGPLGRASAHAGQQLVRASSHLEKEGDCRFRRSVRARDTGEGENGEKEYTWGREEKPGQLTEKKSAGALDEGGRASTGEGSNKKAAEAGRCPDRRVSNKGRPKCVARRYTFHSLCLIPLLPQWHLYLAKVCSTRKAGPLALGLWLTRGF